MIIERQKFQDVDSVTCDCGQTFCFKCELDCHSPATCEQVKDWAKNENIDSSNLGYVREDCSWPCETCRKKSIINKNCKDLECIKFNEEFCWVCNDTWKPI